MKMDIDPPVLWGHLLPPLPAGEPSGSPSPVPTATGKRMQSFNKAQIISQILCVWFDQCGFHFPPAKGKIRWH